MTAPPAVGPRRRRSCFVLSALVATLSGCGGTCRRGEAVDEVRNARAFAPGPPGMVYVADGDAIYEVHLDRGAPRRILSPEGGVRQLASDATHLYWIGGDATGRTARLMRAPRAGGAPQLLAGGLADTPGLAVDARSVYVAHHHAASESAAALLRVPIGGGEPEVVLRLREAPMDVAVDPQHLYWIEAAVVSRRPLAGGPTERLPYASAYGVALHGGQLFFTAVRGSSVGQFAADLPAGVPRSVRCAPGWVDFHQDAGVLLYGSEKGLLRRSLDGGSTSLLRDGRFRPFDPGDADVYTCLRTLDDASALPSKRPAELSIAYLWRDTRVSIATRAEATSAPSCTLTVRGHAPLPCAFAEGELDALWAWLRLHAIDRATMRGCDRDMKPPPHALSMSWATPGEAARSLELDEWKGCVHSWGWAATSLVLDDTLERLIEPHLVSFTIELDPGFVGRAAWFDLGRRIDMPIVGGPVLRSSDRTLAGRGLPGPAELVTVVDRVRSQFEGTIAAGTVVRLAWDGARVQVRSWSQGP